MIEDVFKKEDIKHKKWNKIPSPSIIFELIHVIIYEIDL